MAELLAKTTSQSTKAFPPVPSDETAVTLERDWSPQEEAKAKRKLDFIIMPILTMGFFCLRVLLLILCDMTV